MKPVIFINNGMADTEKLHTRSFFLYSHFLP